MRFTFMSLLIAASLVEQPLVHAQSTGQAAAGLEEIVVTGEKADRSLLETLNSATILTQEQLYTRGVEDIREAVRRTAGVTEVGYNQGFAIRGVSLFGSTNAGSRFSTTINIVVDGVSQDRFSQRINPFDTWDVRQIEIFKGGQSLNLGRSSIAGAVVIDTNDPTYDPEAALEVRAGSYERFGAMAMGNTPLADTLAVRVVGGTTRDDGWIENPTLGIDANKSSNDFARLKLLWEPTQRIRSLTMLNYDDARTGDDFVDARDPFERDIFSNIPAREDNKRIAIAQRLAIEINDSWDAFMLATYQESVYDRLDDSDRSASDEGFLFREEETEEFTLEVRLDYASDTLRGFLGAYAAHKDVAENFGSGGFDVSMFFNQPPGTSILDFDSAVDSQIRNYSVFGELEFPLAQQWSARLAARYDVQDEAFTQSQSSSLPNITAPGSDEDKTDFDELLPFVALTYHISDTSNVSLFYKQAYRSGGVEIDLGNGTTNTFAPEYTESVELAYRGVFDRFVFTSNLYYTQWKDQQVSFSETGQPGLETTQNAGASTQYGWETELNWQVADSVSVYSSASLMSTEFDEFDDNPAIPGDFSGNAFPYTPEIALGVGATYAIKAGWDVDVNVNYQDETFVDPANQIQNDDYVLTNITISYADEDWYAGLSVTNLFDEEYIARNNAAPFAIQVGDPRMALFKLGYRF